MKKIVHMSMIAFTDEMGYQENVLSKYHVKLGYEVTMITSTWKYDIKHDNKLCKTDITSYTNQDGVHVRRLALKGKNDISRKLRRFEGIYETLCHEKPDILFIHDFQFVDIKEIVKYLKYHRNVIVYADNHADYINSARNWMSKNVLHKIIWKYYAHMIEPYIAKFYGVLPIRVDFMIEMYKLPKEKCELLLMGAEDDLVDASERKESKLEVRKKYSIDEDDFLVITGGKIDKWKTQVILLMDAVKRIENNHLKLLIFGSVIPELKEEILNRCDDRIQYIGWMSVEDSYKVIASANLAVYPGGHSTLWEQTAGQGIPMIVKHWEGIHHIDLGGNVKFLYNDNTDEIYNALIEIVDQSEIYIKMRNCATEKKDVFSYKNIARKCLQG